MGSGQPEQFCSSVGGRVQAGPVAVWSAQCLCPGRLWAKSPITMGHWTRGLAWALPSGVTPQYPMPSHCATVVGCPMTPWAGAAGSMTTVLPPPWPSLCPCSDPALPIRREHSLPGMVLLGGRGMAPTWRSLASPSHCPILGRPWPLLGHLPACPAACPPPARGWGLGPKLYFTSLPW